MIFLYHHIYCICFIIIFYSIYLLYRYNTCLLSNNRYSKENNTWYKKARSLFIVNETTCALKHVNIQESDELAHRGIIC